MTAKKSTKPATEGQVQYSQEELEAAAQAENHEMALSVEVLVAQKNHLSNRVVILRSQVARLERQLAQALAHAPKDHQPPKKRAAKKRT